MGKYILESAGKIDWMALGPLILFFVFFLVVTLRAITFKKSYIEKMGNMPLEEE